MLKLEIQQEEQDAVDSQELQSDTVLRRPMPTGQADKLLPSAAKRGNAKKNPSEADEMKDENAAGPASEKRGRIGDVAPA